MGNDQFNQAKGRIIELHYRVWNRDPANCAFVVALGTGSITDGQLITLDNLNAIIADPNFSEPTDLDYDRVVLTPSSTPAMDEPVYVDDYNGTRKAMLPVGVTWTGISGATLTRLLICYDSDTTVPDDSDIIPLTFHDFPIVTDGSELSAHFNARGFIEYN